jgi:hypothetical protein
MELTYIILTGRISPDKNRTDSDFQKTGRKIK